MALKGGKTVLYSENSLIAGFKTEINLTYAAEKNIN